MIRPCYLIIDRETSTSISSRKLVIETAKFNVVSAYTGREAIEILSKFPALDGVVTDSGIADIACNELIAALKAIRSTIPVIVVRTPSNIACELADYTLDSFNPKDLLFLLESLQPHATEAIQEHNEKLEVEHFGG